MTDKTSTVHNAYEEILAIAKKYNVSGLVIVSQPNSEYIKACHFPSMKTETGSINTIASIVNDLWNIINRTFMLLIQNIWTMDITVQSITQGDQDALTTIYNTVEEQMSDGKDEYIDSLVTIVKQTCDKYVRITGKDSATSITPRTVNKIRQIGNALSWEYYTSSK